MYEIRILTDEDPCFGDKADTAADIDGAYARAVMHARRNGSFTVIVYQGRDIARFDATGRRIAASSVL